MKDKKDLFDRFKEREHEIQPTPSRHAWDKLERKLDARKDNNQTSKYRSIAQIAAVVAVVSVVAVITLLNTGGSETSMVSSPVKANSSWEKIAKEKANKNSTDLANVAAVAAPKQVLIPSAAIKPPPMVNKAKSATNKIQNYKVKELAGNIDVASNTYEMHESDTLEREMLLGEVTVNQNTTMEEIEIKALGANADSYVANEVKDEVAIEATEMLDISGFLSSDELQMDSPSEDADIADVLTQSTSVPPTAADRIPQYEVTEINAPNAKTDISVGESNNEYFNNRMNQISAADRKLEESVAEANTKVTRKKKSRDIFSRNKAKRSSNVLSTPSSIGIAANTNSLDSAKDKNTAKPHLFSAMVGTWNDTNNNIQKEWVAVDAQKLHFRTIGQATNIDYELILDRNAIRLTDLNNNRIYRFTNKIEATSFFVFLENEVKYFVEIAEGEKQLVIRSYHQLVGDVEREDLVEQVFVR